MLPAQLDGVLIPYQQGGLFRLKSVEYLAILANVLIPYQQGGLFRRHTIVGIITILVS